MDKTLNKEIMKNTKSLCESCSNRVVIKFHEYKNGQRIKIECIYNFESSIIQNGNYGTALITSFIVDECSFYNKNIELVKIKKKKTKQDSDDSDSDDINKDGSFRNGVTFTNIPGALLP